MRAAHSGDQVRAAEAVARAGLPHGALMARAVAGIVAVAARCLGQVYGARVTLLVGAGDNGADALWAGAALARRGASVTAWLAAPPQDDALAALLAAGGRVADPAGPWGRAAHGGRLPDLVVDGLVGTGGRGPLRPAAAALAARVAGALTLAVDLPSGVDADTGAVGEAAVRADVTVATGSYKPVHLLAPEHCGEVVLVEIGLDLPSPAVQALDAADVGLLLAAGPQEQDKYSRGVLGVAAGSADYPGAAVLAVGAALQAGAGMVRFAGASAPHVLAHWPEAVATASLQDAGRVQAWVVGPGLGTDREAELVVERVLSEDVPVLVDAGALSVCARHTDWLRRRTAPTLLTPHAGEYARFGRQVGPDRLGDSRALAEDLGVHVLLKGPRTVVVGPDGPARVNTTGTPVLATAGSGDVLSGGCAALLARGLSPLQAGSAGAWLHGRAGALSSAGAGSTTAQRVLRAWSEAAREALSTQ